MATPMEETTRRCGSRVEFSAMTANTTSPWLRRAAPSLRVITLQCGGKIEETRTRFCEAMPASRSASSKEVKRSLCFPTPLVRKSRLGTMSLPNSKILRKGFYKKLKLTEIVHCAGRKMCKPYEFLRSGVREFSDGFLIYCDLHKGPRSAAKSLIFAVDQREISADRWIDEAERCERAGSDFVGDVGFRDKTHANIGG